MDVFQIIGLITVLITFLSCLFSFFLITVKGKNRIGNILLAAYLLVSTLELSIFLYSHFIEVAPIIDKLRDDLSFIRIPLFYVYLLSAIYSDFRISNKVYYHLLPFVLIFLLFIPRFYGVSDNQRIHFNQEYYSHPEVIFSIILLHLQELFYIVLAFIQLKKYKKLLLENHSEIISFNYTWLYQLCILWSIIFFVALSKNLLTLIQTDMVIVDAVQLILMLLILVFVSNIVLKALYTPSIFKNINAKYKLSQSSSAISPESGTSKVEAEEEIRLQLNRLQELMRKQELFLDPNLSVSTLASHMDLSSQEVSTLINRHLNMHFYDFVNGYRLERATELLKSNTSKQLTILEILYSVGFNSKSSFNSAFKKYTKLTPTQYRKKHG